MSTERVGLDIVIVNWNTGSYLRDCLLAVAQADRLRFELRTVVIVDNASSDDSLDGIDATALPIQVIRNETNRGFGAACNQGAAASDAPLLLLLNPDTRVTADAIDLTVEFMLDPANARIGICGCRMLDEDGRDEFNCWRFPSFGIWVGKLTGLSYLFPQWIPMQRMSAEELSGSGPVDQVIGAYNLIRRPLYEALGGFDERFFVYLEDVDLALRARELGFSSYYLKSVVVHHVGRVSSEQVRGKRLFYLIRSRTEYARKHWPRWQAGLLAFLMLFVEFPARSLVALARGRRDDVKDVGEAAANYARYLLVGR
jgi:N-acetylglucosaminyl-diphospho-decaprenol L-rhamnosyltransferase